jgi:putative SOS response-associated peptidase YedK
MCGRYSLFAPPADIEERFDTRFAFEFEPRYNAAPRQSLPVIPDDSPGTISAMEWGFVPPWADSRDDFGFINARAETLAEKPTFRAAFRAGGEAGDNGESGGGDPRAGRCLVPADGFYEWVETGDGRQPYRVTLADGEPFAMAGLYAEYRPARTQTGLGDFGDGGPDAGTETVTTYAIVTTEPNGLVADLHDRMSVILPRGEERRWLHEGTAVVGELLGPYPSDEMRAEPVSRAVNDPSNDSPAVLDGPDTAR